MSPEAAMRKALALGRRGRGRTHPNPCVGAVVYRGERVLGTGTTRPVGGPHAEIVALEAAVRRFGARSLRGASLAVTLEPCSHTGRTGPCTREIIASGIRRVVVGHRDPHPEVAGQGLRALRRNGIEVDVGVLEAECRRLHRGFLSVCARGRPFVSLKLASTLDGRIATRSGESRWITGPESRAEVQRLRAATDAILIGSETALADDPELVARLRGRVLHRPVRVVVDSGLRLSPEARLFRGEAGRTWVLCAPSAASRRRRALEAKGARLIDVRPKRRVGSESGTRRRRLDLGRAFAALAQAGLSEVLVEGGGRLAAALLEEGLVDEVHWFTAPRLLGNAGRPALGPLGIAALADAVALENVRVRRRGDDVHVVGDVTPRRPRTRKRSTR